VLFYSHFLTPTNLPRRSITPHSSPGPLTFSPPASSHIPLPLPPLPRTTPDCSPSPTSPSSLHPYCPPLFTSPNQTTTRLSRPIWPPLGSSPTNPVATSFHSTSSASGFPAIDAFIAAHVSSERPGRRGGFRSVRRWESLIVYSITHNRYCENIGREHKVSTPFERVMCCSSVSSLWPQCSEQSHHDCCGPAQRNLLSKVL